MHSTEVAYIYNLNLNLPHITYNSLTSSMSCSFVHTSSDSIATGHQNKNRINEQWRGESEGKFSKNSKFKKKNKKKKVINNKQWFDAFRTLGSAEPSNKH